ncbi:MAG TPA: substrate-binding domain-containing protein [Firmicutes bacterium]|nr:substrate-binding domain-containing protein [Bacillota bacterium]
MRRLMLILVVGVLFVGLLGAGSVAAPKELTIGLSVPSLSMTWFSFLKGAVEAEARKLGNVKIITVDAENKTSKQMSDIEDLIVKKVDGVLLVPIEVKALIPAVEDLNRAKIPVATVDRRIEGSGLDILVHVGADNVEGGRLAARYIGKLLNGKGNVVEIEGTPGSSPARDRGRGFNEVLKKEFPNIKVIFRQPADFRRADGMNLMENILQSGKDFDAVFAHNDDMILGALEALKARAGGKKVITMGFDAIEDALNAVEEGTLNGTIEQFPGKQAATALDILVEYLRTGKAPSSKAIWIEPKVITKANLNDAEKRLK